MRTDRLPTSTHLKKDSRLRTHKLRGKAQPFHNYAAFPTQLILHLFAGYTVDLESILLSWIYAKLQFQLFIQASGLDFNSLHFKISYFKIQHLNWTPIVISQGFPVLAKAP